MNTGDPAQAWLAELRDIHAAAEPGWWPPAPGWWVLAAFAAILMAFAIRRALSAWRVRRRRQRYFAALARIERDIDARGAPAEFLAQMNWLFRAVSLQSFPESARLQGAEWVRFVRAGLPGGVDAAAVEALATGPYRPRPEFDAAALAAAARAWVQRHG